MDKIKAKKIVIKIGTNTIMKDNKFNIQLVNSIAQDISKYRRQGKQFIIVSSGAIGLGLEKLNLNKSNLNLPLQQAIASVG